MPRRLSSILLNMTLSIKNEKDLNKLVDAIALEIVDANIYNRLFLDLLHSLDENHRTHNQSRTFWYLATNAIKDSILIRLCRFYDQEKSSLSILNLLYTIRHHINFIGKEEFKICLNENPFVDRISEIDRSPDLKQLNIDIEFSSNSNPLIQKLIIWRNNVIAHKGFKTVLKSKNILAKHPISSEETQYLLDAGFKILNRYSYIYQASSWSRQIIGYDDYKGVFTFIELGLEKWDLDREEERKRLKEK